MKILIVGDFHGKFPVKLRKLAIGGHLHENQGRCRIGKTVVVNDGAALDRECCVVDFDEVKRKVKRVEFVK